MKTDKNKKQDETRNDQTGAETGEDLRFNEELKSFELDAEIPDPPDSEYQHHDPYDTAVPAGTDHMSTYDEANPYTPNEYRDGPEDLADGLEIIDEDEPLPPTIDVEPDEDDLIE